MVEDARLGTELGGHLIGRGGMSSVYLAEHVRLGCNALKLLSPELATASGSE
jgi:hypothetical protein